MVVQDEVVMVEEPDTDTALVQDGIEELTHELYSVDVCCVVEGSVKAVCVGWVLLGDDADGLSDGSGVGFPSFPIVIVGHWGTGGLIGGG